MAASCFEADIAIITYKETIMTFKRTGLAVALSGVLAIGVALPAYSQISDDKVVIGFITDMSSLYSDLDGAGGAEAIKMAIEDFGGEVNGKKIELYTADHQNKADIAANKVREWIDEQGADFIIGGTNSAAE